jgi:hypothetical protein
MSTTSYGTSASAGPPLRLAVSWFVRPRARHLALVPLLALLLSSTVAYAADRQNGRANRTISNMPLITVDGGPLANITSSPISLSPGFNGMTTDYVWRCQSGTNTIQVTLSALLGRTLRVGNTRGATVTVTVSLLENQALIISAIPSGADAHAQYWFRCLPHDFPQLIVTKPGNPRPGWYLTGSITSISGIGTYAMVLDSNGTPVWYRQPAAPDPFNVSLLPDGTIAWKSNTLDTGFATDPNGAYEDFNLATQATRKLAAPTSPTDFHELEPMSNGDLMFLSTPLTANVDLTALGVGPGATIVDCLLQEVTRDGHLAWQWRASDHISVDESTVPAFGVSVQGQLVYDIFHCNSIDTDSRSRKVLLSTRHTDAVYLIDRLSGWVDWKMGGTHFTHDNAKIIAVAGDPEGTFHNQHDARFQPGGDVSLYDNQSSQSSLAARGVEYHVDPVLGTAILVWSYISPDGHNSAATGSFRRLNGGTDNVIGWGVKENTLFTEVDAAGNVILNVSFAPGVFAYRVMKVDASALRHALLRATAGLPPSSNAQP